uniref:Jerky protein homologlike [Hydra vulgaris] n=1 Tax=Lepeophtheirus salmonis TaxID=72036 RepID=A0A0K2TNF2_LEPSM
MVRSYLNCIGCKNVFRDNRSRKDWMVLFEKRHCHMLTSRKPELLTRARAEGLSEGVINLFFDHYINLLKDNGLNESPHRIFNLDETGLTTDPRSQKVFIKRGSSYLQSATSGKFYHSVLFCASASGKCMHPFTIYKGKDCCQAWMNGGPRGATYDCLTQAGCQVSRLKNGFSQYSSKKLLILISQFFSSMRNTTAI